MPGDDPHISCIAELIGAAIAQQTSQTFLDARKKIWLVDNNGLVTRERGDSSTLEGFKLPFCHSGEHAPDQRRRMGSQTAHSTLQGTGQSAGCRKCQSASQRSQRLPASCPTLHTHLPLLDITCRPRGT